MNNSFSLIVPAYKEEDFIENSLLGLIKAFRNENFDFEIIVIIDKEPDDKTYEIVEKIATNFEEIKILARCGKRGIAKAVLDGINKASKNIIILVMGENSQDPQEIVKMAYKIKEGYDMVFGSRFLSNQKLEKYPLTKYIANRLCNYVIGLLFGIKSNDITNGIKAYKSQILKNMQITSTGFEIFVELPINAYIHGYKNFVEIPIKYYGRDLSFSKFDLKKEAPRYIKVVLKYFLKL